MSDTFARAHDHFPASDRRAHARQAIPSLAYVELDEGNGGIILNISEGGLSVQAVAGLMDDFLPGVRFQLAETESWIETNARITWTNDTRKLAGLEFLNLTDDSRGRIREWLLRDALGARAAGTSDTANPEEVTTAELQAIPTGDSSDPAEAAPLAASVHPDLSLAKTARQPTLGSAVTADVTPAADTEAEAVSSVLADLMTSVSDHDHAPLSPAPMPIPFRQAADAKAADVKPATRTFAEAESMIGDRWSAAVVLITLAVGSLAAGWVAGQGQLTKVIAKLHGGAEQGAEQIRGALQHLRLPPAAPSAIEVENVNGQRWTIPFNGPMNSPNEAGRRQASGYVSGTEARKPQPGFRTWILTPPQQTRAAINDGALKEAPPVVPETSNVGENVLTSPGARSLAAPPALPVPAPPTPTGVVKQGELIHRVDPSYPVIAKEQHSEGTVRLNITVGTDGVVRGVSVLGGPRLLIDAAQRAVRQWRYTPTLLDGKPVEFQREVDLTFRLSAAPR